MPRFAEENGVRCLESIIPLYAYYVNNVRFSEVEIFDKALYPTSLSIIIIFLGKVATRKAVIFLNDANGEIKKLILLHAIGSTTRCSHGFKQNRGGA